MNWDALGAIAELVGSAAVVATLAYLSIQTHRNTVATRSASNDQARRGLTDVMALIAGDEDTAALYYAGLTKPESLEGHRQVRFDTLLTLQLRATEVMFTDRRQGLLSEDHWGGHWRAYRRTLASRGGGAWWMRNQHCVSEEFRDWLNTELGVDPEGPVS